MQKIHELNRIRTVSLLDYLPSCYRVSLLPICLCSDVLTTKSRRQNNTEKIASNVSRLLVRVGMAKWRGMRLKNGGIGNYSRCNEFESNFATPLHWIIWKWAAMRGICSGERESLFGMRCSPQSCVRDGEASAWCLKVHHLDQVRARLCKYAGYIIQEAEQINQCIMGLKSLRSEKL